MRIRPATTADAAALSALWSSAGLAHREDLVAEELASVLGRDPELVLLAEDDSGLAGSVFGAYDGRRAWVNRLATRPDVRGQGIASRLMQALDLALVDKGCRKVNLLIEPENSAAVGFYERLGFASDELIFMGKHLDG